MMYRQIRYFVSIVENGSFTEAAEQNYISQSAMSQQIQALENALGAQLLVRGNRRFVVTPAGRHLYDRAKAWLKAADRMLEETVRIARAEHPEIRLAYLNSYSGPEFGASVAAFTRRHPDIALSITKGTHEELYSMICLGQADLVFSDPRHAFLEEYFNEEVFEALGFVELVMHHPFAQRSGVMLAELRNVPCILISSKGQQRAEETYYRQVYGVESPVLFAENLEEARMMVVSGRGYLPMLEAGLDRTHEMAMIRRVPLYKGDRQFRKSYYAFWRKTPENPLLEEFAQILRAQASSQV